MYTQIVRNIKNSVICRNFCALVTMKNPWEYMGTEKNPNKKKNEKNNKDDSDDEDSKGGKEDDPYIIKLIKVYIVVI